jgi:IclR family transcriptional regulator, pca regulon regulatory protein
VSKTQQHGQTLTDTSGRRGQPASPNAQQRYSLSLEHGLAILACFTAERPVLGITDIANIVGMSRSTTHRYASTLLELGYLEQTRSRKYQLGTRVSDLGMSALDSLRLRTHALPHLRELRIRSHCTASLSILDGTDIMYLARVRSYQRGQHEIDLGLRVASRLPAHCTAMGKVLLAYLPEEERREAMKTKLSRCTERTITSKKMLRVELERIRERGIAVNDRELAETLHAIAAPVRDESGEVIAAIGIAAHTSRLSYEELVLGLRSNVLTAAARISAHLGYSGDDDDAALGQAA